MEDPMGVLDDDNYISISLQIVVKPSGVMWHGSAGVTFHHRTDVVNIWKAALQLLSEVEEENVIIVEAFYSTIYAKQGTGVKWACGDNYASRVRATVVRGHDDIPCMSKVGCSEQSSVIWRLRIRQLTEV